MADLQQAHLLLNKGSLEESFKILSQYIESHSTEECSVSELADAYNTRGHIRYLWVDFNEAIADYTEAINRTPDLYIAHYNRGQVHYRLGQKLW